MLTVDYLMGYRDDKPTRFHDIIRLKKCRGYADSAALYAANNPSLAEYFLNLIGIEDEVGRKEYNYAVLGSASAADVHSIEATNQQIAHIHKACAEEIKSSWKPLDTDEANLKLLDDMKIEHPRDKEFIELLQASITGKAANLLEGKRLL